MIIQPLRCSEQTSYNCLTCCSEKTNCFINRRVGGFQDIYSGYVFTNDNDSLVFKLG